MTLKDIAQQAGVSISTVSRVLNGTATISQPVKDQIMAIAQATGYLDKIRKNKTIEAPSLAGKKLLLVTPRDAVLNRSGNMISYTLVESIKKACNEQKIALTSFLTEANRLSVQKLHQLLNKQQYDGIVVVWADQSELLAVVSEHHIPTVLINGEDRAMNVDSVGVSNRYGAMAAVNHLLDKGHQDIGLLSYSGRQTIYLRENGYRDSLNCANKPIKPEHHITADDYSDVAAEAAVETWLSRYETLPVTALFCVTDGLALGAMSALQRHGYRIPEDISIVGMDGILPLDLIEPQLTTVKLPFESLPAEALRILERKICFGEKRDYHIHLELSCELVERDSVIPHQQ
ncbi:LacI family DNA-binding transcriptional regulator (plasmid) [Photobacterium sp. DA100]|uniref:LacI family DNA-binding transcriptional regulator n=1 Tax=Photobacterium sp. DA100 TaxID=3027472 RepID=UPI0024788376|nr:LacI family DNA-binding transcriptional regulator [Photobacterium sp. DA100]WEM44681.1 LacI family DNA-binding transcriptional regulator [Photobacterium sp. DA100]